MQISGIAQKSLAALALTLIVSSCGRFGDEAAPVETTEAPTTTTTEATTTTTTSPVDIDRYCELAILSDAKTDAFFDGDGPGIPEEFEAYIVDLRSDIEEAVMVAEPSIQPDLAIVKEEIEGFSKILAENDYDIATASVDLAAVPENPEWVLAQEAVDAYDEEVCGIEPDDDETDPQEEASTDPVDGMTLAEAELAVTIMETQAGMDLVVEGFRSQVPNVTVEQAECFLGSMSAEQFLSFTQLGESPDDIDPSSPVLAEVITLLAECDIPLTALLP